MRILLSAHSDPTLCAAPEHMAKLHATLEEFLTSAATELELSAQLDGDPSPYHTFLPGLHVRKAVGPIVLSLRPDGWLLLQGSRKNLHRYVSYFSFPSDLESGHHHPENDSAGGYISTQSLNLVIEVAADFRGDSAA